MPPSTVLWDRKLFWAQTRGPRLPLTCRPTWGRDETRAPRGPSTRGTAAWGPLSAEERFSPKAFFRLKALKQTTCALERECRRCQVASGFPMLSQPWAPDAPLGVWGEGGENVPVFCARSACESAEWSERGWSPALLTYRHTGESVKRSLWGWARRPRMGCCFSQTL